MARGGVCVAVDGRWVVVGVFALSSVATVLFILRRPYLQMRMWDRHIFVETYFLGALLGPVLIIAAGILKGDMIFSGLSGQNGPNALGILALFLSMVFISIFLDIAGVFEYFARLALKMAHRSGTRLFFSLYITVSVLTVFTSNDIIILAFTPFVYYFARKADINPTPYLIAEFFAANTWSMMLYIGNPTNILVASAFHLKFLPYTAWMLVPTLAAGTVNAVLLYLLFRRDIRKPIGASRDLDPASAITDRAGAIAGSVVLGACVVALAVAPYLHVDMWTVAVSAALVLAAVLVVRDSYARKLRRELGQAVPHHSVHLTLRRMPWSIVPFVLSLFVTVEALRASGVMSAAGVFLARLCGDSEVARVLLYGTSSALMANVLNNIPMTAAFASVMAGLSGRPLLSAALATIIGSNLGANITPLGALAGIMWMSILRDKDHCVSFGEFIRCGLIVTPPSLAACLGVLAAELHFLG